MLILKPVASSRVGLGLETERLGVLLPATLLFPAAEPFALPSLQPAPALSGPHAHLAPSHHKKKKEPKKKPHQENREEIKQDRAWYIEDSH